MGICKSKPSPNNATPTRIKKLNANIFIPKPRTPLARLPLPEPEQLRAHRKLLRKGAQPIPNVKLRIGSMRQARIQLVLARGDRRAQELLLALAETSVACQQARAVLIPIIVAFPPGGHGAIDILGIATFYIAGWDRQGPWGDEDMDGDTVDDMVWGYFLQDQDVVEAWNVQWGYSDDPFAPTRVLLTE